jgi:hypothetical protein
MAPKRKVFCLVAVLVVLLGLSPIALLSSYRRGFQLGYHKGEREGQTAALYVQSWRRLANLELLKRGDVTKAVSRLDYCLDQDVLAINDGGEGLDDPQLVDKYLTAVARQRQQYPRVPYEGSLRDRSLASRVDKLLERKSTRGPAEGVD